MQRSMGKCTERAEAALRVDAWSGQRAGHDIAHVLWIVRAKLALIIPVFACAVDLLHTLNHAAEIFWSDTAHTNSNIRIERIPAFLTLCSLLLPHLCHERHDREFERGKGRYYMGVSWLTRGLLRNHGKSIERETRGKAIKGSDRPCKYRDSM